MIWNTKNYENENYEGENYEVTVYYFDVTYSIVSAKVAFRNGIDLALKFYQ